MERDRLGLPTEGRGSLAGAPRRLVALLIDWGACLLVSAQLLPGVDYPSGESSLATLAVFSLEVVVLTWLAGASFGQRLVGLRVLGATGQAPGLGRVLTRTALLLLVIPAVVWDPDGRGLHDRAAGTLVVRA